MSVQRVAFIGLGVMGYPMAGHLARAGYQVTVWNRTRAKADAWVEAWGGTGAGSPAAAADGADLVLTCVGNDDDVRSVVYGDTGVLAGLAPGAVLVDHTTTSALLAEELGARCQKQGCLFLDAPVSGGQAGAEKGQLTVMCGGEPDVFARIQPVLQAYAARVTLMGAVGQGQRAKMVNQICISGVLQGLSEGLLLAEQAGLDSHQLVQTLSAGAAGSWQMQNRAETMLAGQFDFGFAIDWMRKDLDYALAEAERYGLTLANTEQTNRAYADLQAEGQGRSDTSALILSHRRRPGDASDDTTE